MIHSAAMVAVQTHNPSGGAFAACRRRDWRCARPLDRNSGGSTMLRNAINGARIAHGVYVVPAGQRCCSCPAGAL
jgi:hypothetical protein